VVANSIDAQSGTFIENIGTYNPVVKPTHLEIDADRALHWLLHGARPTETTAYLLSKIGVLDRFFEQRPNCKKDYSFLDKTTAATSKKSAVDEAPKAEKAKKEKADEEAPAEAASRAEAASELSEQSDQSQEPQEAASAEEPKQEG